MIIVKAMFHSSRLIFIILLSIPPHTGYVQAQALANYHRRSPEVCTVHTRWSLSCAQLWQLFNNDLAKEVFN